MQRSYTFSPSRPDPNAKPDLQALRRWIVAICCIRFDLEQGQLVEAIYPPGALSSEEESDVSFSSFPDSMTSVHNRASLHDSLFFFRVRRRGAPVVTQAQRSEPAKHSPSGDGENFVTPQRGGAGAADTGTPRTSADHGNWTDMSRPVDGSPSLYRRSSNRSWPAAKMEPSEVESPKSPLWSGQGGASRYPEADAVTRRLLRDAGDSARRATLPAGSFNSSLVGSPQSPMGQLGLSASLPHDRAANEDRLSPSPQTPANGSSKRGGKEDSAGSKGGPRYLYGFVFNRQRHDERLRRGGEQKSVVVLSERPYSSVFRPLAQLAGPLYFDIGAPALERVAALVSQWPAPRHGTTMELPCGSSTIKGPLPPAHTLPPSSHTPLDDFTAAMAPATFNKAVPQGIFYEADIYGTCRGVLIQLWVLWELLLVGEPLLVMAPSPQQCSEAVAALVSLIAPLPCSLDFRPYFTIHDPDFPLLNALREGDPVPPMVLGVTNLFFLKALRTLPHVVSIGIPGGGPGSRFGGGPSRPNSQVSSRPSPPRLQVATSHRSSPLQRFSPHNLFSQVARIRKEGPLSLMTEHREALWTNYVPSIKPDAAILNRLIDAIKPSSSTTSSSSSQGGRPSFPSATSAPPLGSTRSAPAGGFASLASSLTPSPSPSSPSAAAAAQESLAMVNNDVLRRHFVELTTNFLAPFGPFLRAAAPPEGASPFGDPPPLPPFDAHEFLEGLAARGPGKFLSKRLQAGSWVELYRRFMEGPNFMPWFRRRRAVAEAEQHRLWRAARCRADVRKHLPDMGEAQLAEAFASVERHIIWEVQRAGGRGGLSALGGGARGDTPVMAKLRGDLRLIFNALPRDLQKMLLFQPQHATVLQGGREPTRLPGRISISRDRDSLGGDGSPAASSPGGSPRAGSHWLGPIEDYAMQRVRGDGSSPVFVSGGSPLGLGRSTDGGLGRPGHLAEASRIQAKEGGSPAAAEYSDPPSNGSQDEEERSADYLHGQEVGQSLRNLAGEGQDRAESTFLGTPSSRNGLPSIYSGFRDQITSKGSPQELSDGVQRRPVNDLQSEQGRSQVMDSRESPTSANVAGSLVPGGSDSSANSVSKLAGGNVVVRSHSPLTTVSMVRSWVGLGGPALRTSGASAMSFLSSRILGPGR